MEIDKSRIARNLDPLLKIQVYFRSCDLKNQPALSTPVEP